jgi:hypothetical protein
MPENEISQIVEMIKQNLPKTKIYRVEKSLAAFSLSFREID